MIYAEKTPIIVTFYKFPANAQIQIILEPHTWYIVSKYLSHINIVLVHIAFYIIMSEIGVQSADNIFDPVRTHYVHLTRLKAIYRLCPILPTTIALVYINQIANVLVRKQQGAKGLYRILKHNWNEENLLASQQTPILIIHY